MVTRYPIFSPIIKPKNNDVQEKKSVIGNIPLVISKVRLLSFFNL